MRVRKNDTGHTAHGEACSFAAFMGLPDEERGSACEMGTVIGLKSDGRCLLTLYQRPCKFQLALLVPGKDSASTESEPARAGGAMPRTHPNGPGGPARRERELGKRGTGVYAPVSIAAKHHSRALCSVNFAIQPWGFRFSLFLIALFFNREKSA